MSDLVREKNKPVPSARYQRMATLIVMVGVTMGAVDTTAVILGLPVMIRDLQSDVISLVWVIMSYLLVITVLGTQVGKLGDMFGRVRMYNFGFAFFTASSLLCGLSTSGWELVAFRILQGVGGALISSNSGAIIADTYERSERGKAYGIIGIGFIVGAALGILVGGIFATFFSWRYIFFINLPVGAIGTILGYLKLKERSPKMRAKFDLVGMSLFGTGLSLVLYALTEIAGSGFTFLYSSLLLSGGLALVCFVFWERHYSQPMIPISVLRQRILSASIAASFFQYVAFYAVMFLMIMYLQGPRGLTPFNASLLYIPAYVLSGFISPFAGRLSDKFGARFIASLGLAVEALGFMVYSIDGMNTSLLIVVVGGFIGGAGTITFIPANSSAVMSAAPSEAYGIVSGLARTFSNVGMVCSFVVALLVVSLSIPRQLALGLFLGVGGISPAYSWAFVDGMRSVLYVSVSMLAVAMVLSLLRGKENRSITSLQNRTHTVER